MAEGGTLTINGTPHNAAEAVTTGPDGLPLPHTVTLPEGVDVAFSALPDASHTLAALTVTGLPVGHARPRHHERHGYGQGRQRLADPREL